MGIVRLEGLIRLKNPVTSSGFEPATYEGSKIERSDAVTLNTLLEPTPVSMYVFWNPCAVTSLETSMQDCTAGVRRVLE
jgi:hypothetical protein